MARVAEPVDSLPLARPISVVEAPRLSAGRVELFPDSPLVTGILTMGFPLLFAAPLAVPVAVGASLIGAVCSVESWRAIQRRRIRRLWDNAPVWNGRPRRLAGIRRIMGTVRAAVNSFRSLNGRVAVFGRYTVGQEHPESWSRLRPLRWECYGFDFAIEASDGLFVRVLAQDAQLFPHASAPRRDRSVRPSLVGTRWVYEETVIEPGEVVEVMGAVDLVSDPAASSASDRSPRLAAVVHGGSQHSLYVRRLRDKPL
jgi:hypothetical protein